MPVSTERPKDALGTLRRLWSFLRRQWIHLFVVGLLIALTTGFNLLVPYLTGLTIDAYIMKKDLVGLTRVVLFMLSVSTAAALTTWLQAYVMAAVAQTTVRDIRDALFAKFQTLELRFIDQHSHGELMSRFTNDVDNISTTLSESVLRLGSGVLMVSGVTVTMFVLSWRLAMVTLLTVPIMMCLTRWIATRTRQGYREQQAALGELNGIIEESIVGARVIKAYCREAVAVREFEVVNQKLRDAAVRAQTFSLTLPPLMNFVNNTGTALVAGAGGLMALQGWVTVGLIAAFISYAQQFARPLNEIATLINAFQAALAGAERVFQLLDAPSEAADAPDALPLEKVHGDVVFDHVTFAYTPGVPVLQDVSLQAQAGETIALVGPTGAGKTTLSSLLLRFYDVDAGALRVDGIDLRQVRRNDLRRRIGIVLQDTYLFSESVLENIRYGRLDATDDEVVAAAKLANADDFIRHLPQGYRTPLAERGSNLSLGQRQLLAIARAILADPSILILDEATSSVDTRTERNIQQALLRLMEERTCFVIAHRLRTIRDADTILVIRNGRIVERGSHEELMAQRGFYYNLYMSQFKGQPTT